MDIAFRTRKLEKVFASAARLRKQYGNRMAEAIENRMTVLMAADVLERVPTDLPLRRHQLRGKRKGQFAVDLVHPHRLVFEPNQNPLPRKQDGGIDEARVSAITIIEVVDYH